jgi:hypothetical protein
MIKTKWVIEPDRVSIYPYGILNIMGIFFAVIMIGISLFLSNSTGGTSLPLIAFSAITVLLVFAFARNSVVFDNTSRMMYRKLFGVLNTKTVGFNELHGIKVVTTTAGGYNYRIFLKKDPHGKGVPVSSGFTKRNETNARAYASEVIPAIEHYLAYSRSGPETVSPPVTSFTYYQKDQQLYIVKNSKPGKIFMSLVLMAISIFFIANPAIFKYEESVQKYISIVGCMIGSLAILAVAFTKITFDTYSKTVKRIMPLGLGTKQILFEDFTGFNIVRRTTNMIYSGTDIHMNFHPQGAKPYTLVVKRFRKTKKIERFLEETRTLLSGYGS